MILPALLALAATLAGCGKQTEAHPGERAEDIRPVRVQKIDAAALARSIEFAGEVRPRYETRLGFRVGGKMTERLVEVGAMVRAGQPIARLDPRDLELAAASAKTQIAQLEAERRFAEGDLRRYRELRARNFISQAELDRRASNFDAIVARLESARAQYRQSENQAGYAVLRADTAGVVTAIEAEAGQVVAPGQTIARLARKGPHGIESEIAVAVPESRRLAFEKAGAYTLELNALPGRKWTGRLRELSPSADPVTRTYAAKVTIVEPGDEVELGMSARVSAVVSTAERRIELPVAALYGKAEQMQVWIVDGLQGGVGSVRLQPVKTRGLAGDHVLVDSGIASGDLVVIAGAQLLRAGQRVRVVEPK
jgi:RND family efflux transporter MFP subunit